MIQTITKWKISYYIAGKVVFIFYIYNNFLANVHGMLVNVQLEKEPDEVMISRINE